MKIPKSLRIILLVEIGFSLILLANCIYIGFCIGLARCGIIHTPGLLGLEYYQSLTAHGVNSIFLSFIFFSVGIGHLFVWQFLKMRPSLKGNLLSLSFLILGTVLVLVTIFSGRASVLNTFYPPP